MTRSSRIIKPRDKQKIPTSSIRGISGFRSSDIPFGTKIPPENEGMNREKRRNFRDHETDHRPNVPDPGSREDFAADASKTSEYAFFKKLKKDAGQSQFHHLHKEDDQVNNAEFNNCTREKFRTLEQNYKGLRFSVPIEKERPGDHNCFSPPGCVSKSSEIINMVGTSGKDIRFGMLNQNVTPINHDLNFHGYQMNTGKQHFDKGVFSSKRQKLRQWVADTSLHEVDELCFKGFDLVSMLLSRLFPEDKEDNRNWEPKSSQVEIETIYELPSFLKSDIHFNGHHWTRTNNLMESDHGSYQDEDFSRYLSYDHNYGMESEHGSYQDEDFSRYFSYNHKYGIDPELDDVGTDSPSTSYPVKIHSHSKYRKPHCNLDGRRTDSLCANSNSRFHLSLEEYGSTEWDHLKEFAGSHDANSSSLQIQPHTLLLGWGYDNEKDERDVSMSAHNSDISLSANSGDNDVSQSCDNQIESALCSASLFSNYFLNSSSLAHPHSAGFLGSRDFEEQFKDERYVLSELDGFPLPLLCTYNVLEPRSVICYPQEHPWNLNKDFYEKRDRRFESHFLSADPGLDIGRKCLSMTDSSTENHLSNYHAFHYPQHDESPSHFLGEEEKEISLYNSNCTCDFSEDKLHCKEWSVVSFEL